MKKIIFTSLFVLGYALLPAQDYSLLYKKNIPVPPPPPNQQHTKAISYNSSGIYFRLLIKEGKSIYYSTTFDTLFHNDYNAHLKSIVYYGDIEKKEFYKVDNTFLTDYYTTYSFSNDADWKIHKKAIPFKSYHAYLATKQLPDGAKISVYFVPDIPIYFGPEKYAGLPGLIVRVQEKGIVTELVKIENVQLEPIEQIDRNTLQAISNVEFQKKRKSAIIEHTMNN